MQQDLDSILQATLREEWGLLSKSVDHLRVSYDKCRNLMVQKDYSEDELEKYESLTARFARVSDLYTQRILKTLVALSREQALTFIDRVNLCEKLGAVPSAEELRNIRDLRNSIAHEYTEDDLRGFFEDVLHHIPKLLKAIETTHGFIRGNMKMPDLSL